MQVYSYLGFIKRSEPLMAVLLLYVIYAPSWASAQMPRMDMALIPAGMFILGSDAHIAYQQCLQNNKVCKKKWFADEEPKHSVYLESFYLDKYEVSQKQYLKVMGGNPSQFKGENRPVEGVTWHEANEYCEQVGKRLPTEVEWEKAARAGQRSIFHWGNQMVSGKANFCDRHCSKKWKEAQFDDGFAETAPVGSYSPNDYGLYDMAGNVYEWVQDWYDEDYYKTISMKAPKGPLSGTQKVVRGGSWINYSVGVRPSDRTGMKTNRRYDFVGFRCAQ